MRSVPLAVAAAVLGVGLVAAGRVLAQPARPQPEPGLLTPAQLAWLQDLVWDSAAVLVAGRMPLSVAFGQASVETGWGKSLRDNPWGKRGQGDVGSQLITTHEDFAPGTSTKLHDQVFAAYSGVPAAALGYVAFLNGPRYRPFHVFRYTDPARWLLGLWAAGYATGNNYAESCKDRSRTVARALGEPDLEVPWSTWHQGVADQLGAVAAGNARMALGKQLLGVG